MKELLRSVRPSPPCRVHPRRTVAQPAAQDAPPAMPSTASVSFSLSDVSLPRPRRPGRRAQLSGASARQDRIAVRRLQGVLRQSLRDMPAYVEAVLPDKDVADIYAFLQSLPGHKPAKELPALEPMGMTIECG